MAIRPLRRGVQAASTVRQCSPVLVCVRVL